ncbi:MAG TPA: sulfotransferase domain-containing protein [Terriglobales bacterium]
MVTIVSGLPRSGTSLMMQMLAAGGLPVLSDGERKADTDNPKGYLEWERIKQLPKDPGIMAEAEGKVVKVISQLLLSLPAGHEYRVIFMQRPLPEVMKSQEEMLRRRGTHDPNADTAPVEQAFQRHLIEVNKWLAGKPGVQVMRVHYHRVLREAKTVAEELAQFLGVPLDIGKMAQQVDGTLYRNRMNGGKV